MTLPGVTDEAEVRKLLQRLADGRLESLWFAVAARGPRDGDLALNRKRRLKRKDVLESAREDARERFGAKAPKVEVLAGECRPLPTNASTLKLLVEGKAPARAVACLEHLLARGPYKVAGFKSVLLEEVEDFPEEDFPEEEFPIEDSPPNAPAKHPARSRERFGATSDVEPPAVPPTGAAAVAAAEKFNARLASLVAPLRTAAGTPDGEAARLKASEAGTLARKRFYDAAHGLLDEVDMHLRRAKGPSVDARRLRRFNERLKSLAPVAREFDATPAGRDAIAALRQAGRLAHERQFDRAEQLLDEADSLLGTARAASSVPGEVEADEARAATFFRDWSAACRSLRLAIDDVQEQLGRLAEALLATNDPNMVWIAEEGITRIVSPLRAGAASLERLAGKRPDKVAAFARPQLAELERRLDAREVAACDQNQFGVAVRIRRTLEPAFAKLRSVLDSTP